MHNMVEYVDEAFVLISVVMPAYNCEKYILNLEESICLNLITIINKNIGE